MDLDCDSESMDGHMEDIDIKEEPIGLGYEAAHAGLSLTSLVYTTRLDDMAILNSNISQLRPRKVTAAIIKESKPRLLTFPNDNISRANKKTFNAIKAKLKEIYHLNNTILETSDIKLEFPDPIFNTETDSIKCEVPEDSIDTSKSENVEDLDIKSEVLDEPINVCKYSELLKLCRPCSVALPILYGYEIIRNYSAQRCLTLKPVNSKKVNKRTEYNDAPIDIASSSDDEALITLNSNLRLKLQSNDSEQMHGFKTKTGAVKVSKPSRNRELEPTYEEKLIASFHNRILTDGLLEVKELYSNERDIYCSNNKGNLLGHYKEKDDMVLKNKQVLVKSYGHSYYQLKSCCWVQRDRIIQSLYPKVLLYSSLRFMRKPHTCPAGACSCCCQRIPETDKADMELIESRYSGGPPLILKEHIKMQALEKEIQSAIVQMNKEPRIYPDSILWNLLDNPKTKLPLLPVRTRGPLTLIDKALMYKKPLPKKPINNRRLVSLKLENSQTCVIVLRNYAADEREIYELNPDGDLKSYLKLTCFHNTDRPDVKKLLQKTKHFNDVCCWFKRENIITELIESKTIHLSAVKFIRTRHTCTGDECSCCCKPAETKDIKLAEITFPKRPFYRSEFISRTKAPPKPSIWVNKNIMNNGGLPSSSITIPASTPHLSAPKLLPKNMPATTKTYVPVSSAKPINNQLMESVSFDAATITTPTPDDDCQFVGVRAAPILGHDLNSTQTVLPQNITNVQSDVLSEEVDTLITSILERFKDVRLTINSDGKVSAALNTPVSSLTTVELKVLANILSYAQSQVNSLGLNAGTSLSNIINFKVSDPQSAINLDPASMYKVLGNNVNVTVRNPTAQVNTATANISQETAIFPDISSAANKYDMFTKCMSVKNKEYTNSFASLLRTKLNAEPEESISNSNVPVIQNVFSLKDQTNINTGNDTSSTTVFCRKPANQSQQPSASQPDTQKTNDNGKKRAPDDAEVTPVTKKIRVLSPSKLHAAPVDEYNSNPMVNSVHQSLPTIQNRALEISGTNLGLPLLSNINNTFRVVSVPRPQAPAITKPRIIREHNFKPLAPQPSIASTPLQVANLNDNVVQNLPMGTLYSVGPVGASSQEIEIQEIPIKLEEDGDEDVDCILGV